MANHAIFAPTFHGDAATVKRLLDQDASLVGVRDAKNLTPLHVAASRGQSEVAQLLIDYGADVGGGTLGDDSDDVWTPLVFASYRGHFEVAQVLIENGACVTTEGGNPIHFAAQRKHKDICRLLVSHGAIDDLLNTEDEDAVAMFRAAYSYDADAVEQILSRRPELICFRDRDGRTVLHEACTGGDTKTVRVLLKNGADATLVDVTGQTPTDRAAAHNQHAVTKLLTKHLDK
ncbi:MAG: ankyrin repeat domain-containing protein [Aureliella sp.]